MRVASQIDSQTLTLDKVAVESYAFSRGTRPLDALDFWLPNPILTFTLHDLSHRSQFTLNARFTGDSRMLL